MTELANAFGPNGGGGAGWSFQKDAQAQEWARQQALQQQRQSQFTDMQMSRLKQENNQHRPLFGRGQDNDRFYQQSTTGNTYANYGQVQMQVGGNGFKPIETKVASLVNNFQEKAQHRTYDDKVFQQLNPGGKPSDIDFKSLTPDNFTRYQLFYVDKSPYCQNFLHLLCQTPELDKEVQKINVNELKQNGHRVEGLRGVPTIIDGQNVYLGNEALGWLAERTSNRISGMSLDDEGFSPIDQSTSQTAWSDTAVSGNNFSYVFEDNQVADFDARSLMAPQDGSGRTAGNSMDHELKRLQMLRDQQIQVVRSGNPQQSGGGGGYHQQQSFPSRQGNTGGNDRYQMPTTPAPVYNPSGPNQMSGGQRGMQQSGYPPQQGGYPPQQQSGYPQQQSGYAQQGYPQQQQYGGGYGQQAGGGQLPAALQAQDPKGQLGPYANRGLRR